MTTAERRIALGAFLRERRHALTPDGAGLAAVGRRHVRGLRREEVAARAGIGVSWYTLLEQGRASGVTDRTLEQVARALLLTPVEREHLVALARVGDVVAAEDVPPPLTGFVSTYPHGIAFLTRPSGTVVAWNAAAAATFRFPSLPPSERNLVAGIVRGTRFRDVLPEWPSVLDNMIAVMRANYGRFVDAEFDTLVATLTAESSLFAESWRRHRVETIPLHDCSVRDPGGETRRLTLFAFAPLLSPHHTFIALVPSSVSGENVVLPIA